MGREGGRRRGKESLSRKSAGETNMKWKKNSRERTKLHTASFSVEERKQRGGIDFPPPLLFLLSPCSPTNQCGSMSAATPQRLRSLPPFACKQQRIISSSHVVAVLSTRSLLSAPQHIGAHAMLISSTRESRKNNLERY